MLIIPHCRDNRLTDGGKVVSPTHRPRSDRQEHHFSASGTHFCWRLSKRQGPVRPERLGKLKKIIKLVGSPTCDLLAHCLNDYAKSSLSRDVRPSLHRADFTSAYCHENVGDWRSSNRGSILTGTRSPDRLCGPSSGCRVSSPRGECATRQDAARFKPVSRLRTSGAVPLPHTPRGTALRPSAIEGYSEGHGPEQVFSRHSDFPRPFSLSQLLPVSYHRITRAIYC
jgi:hypothetical protein